MVADAGYEQIPLTLLEEHLLLLIVHAQRGICSTDILPGSHPIIQDTKSDFKGLAGSGRGEYQDNQQPMSHFHSLFYDLFTVRVLFSFFFFPLPFWWRLVVVAVSR